MSQRDKPRLALNNITAGVREREDANRTRVAGHLDEIQGVVANMLNVFRNGAVGFIDWLGPFCAFAFACGVAAGCPRLSVQEVRRPQQSMQGREAPRPNRRQNRFRWVTTVRKLTGSNK